MDEKTKQIIEEAGWYEGRSIDIDYMLEELKNSGYIVNPVIVGLLKEFWNLNLEFIAPDGRFNNIRLNVEAASYYSKKDLEKISAYLQEEIIPVGEIHEGAATLLVSASGKFYMISDNGFFKIGDNFPQALDVIINEKAILRIA